jgi:hypothetical protein
MTYEELKRFAIEADKRGDREAAYAAMRRMQEMSAPPQEEQKPSVGMLEGITTQAIDGLTLGFRDEIGSAVLAAGSYLNPNSESSGSFGERYRSIRDADRARSREFRDENPIIATGANIAGSLPLGAVGATRQGAVRVAQSIPKLIGAGAAVGGVAGVGYSEADDAAGVAQDAVTGAVIGGAAGGLIPPVAKAVGSVASAPVRYLRSTRATRAADKLGQAIARDDMTPQKVAANLRKLPKGASIADAGGENLQTLGRDVTVQPGRARNIARNLFEGRRKLAPERIDDAVRDALKQGNEFHASKAALQDEMRTAAAPLYRQAYAKPVRSTPELEALLKRPSMQKAIESGRKMAREEGGVIGGNVQVLDYAKRALDDMAESAARSGNKQEARAIRGTIKSLLKELDMQIPEYAQARAAFAGPKSLDDALDVGRKFMREDAEDIASTLSQMTPSEKEFFRIGAIREIRDLVLSKSDTANAYRAIFDSPLKREKIRALFPDNKSFAKFQRAMLGEARMFETQTKALANSSTANKLSGVQDLEMDPGTLVDAVTGSPTVTTINVVKTWLRRHAPSIKNEKMRDEIAEMLFNANPQDQQKILRQIGAKASMQSLNDAKLKVQGAVVGSQQAVSQSN